MSSPLTRNTPKSEAVISLKRGPALRQKNVRQNANIKSRAIVSTDSSSSENDSTDKLNIKEPLYQAMSDRSLNRSPNQTGNCISLRETSAIHNKVPASSSEEVIEVDNKVNIHFLRGWYNKYQHDN